MLLKISPFSEPALNRLRMCWIKGQGIKCDGDHKTYTLREANEVVIPMQRVKIGRIHLQPDMPWNRVDQCSEFSRPVDDK